MSVSILDSGSLFETDADAIVNAVNCVGVMGKGLALEFKNRFPNNFKAYASACASNKIRPGGIFVFEEKNLQAPVHIVNFATKDHWRDGSQLSWIAEGAYSMRTWAEANNISKIACPALGAGLGGLPWDPVKSILLDAFKGSDVEVMLFAPQGTPSPRPWKPRF